MPTYQYKCKECGIEFEYFQSMSEPALTEWPVEIKRKCLCTAGVVRKVGMGSGVILKGTGFYETDYVKKSGSPSTSSSVGNNNNSSSGSEKSGNQSQNNSQNKSNDTKANGSNSSESKVS